MSIAVKHGTLLSAASLLILKPSRFASLPFVGVFIIKLNSPECIKSGILSVPSHIFGTDFTFSIPFSFKNLAVPEVAYIL